MEKKPGNEEWANFYLVYLEIVFLILQNSALHLILEKSYFSPLYFTYKSGVQKNNLDQWGSFLIETELLLYV